MNVFSFLQRNNYFHSVKDEIYHSTRQWNISSFTSWNYLYHCTHKYSLFVGLTLHGGYQRQKKFLYGKHCSSYNIEWQIFCNTETQEKLQKLSTKWKTQKIVENSILVLKNIQYPRKSFFLEYFKIKFIIKNLRLVKLLWKFNKNFIVYLSMWYR